VIAPPAGGGQSHSTEGPSRGGPAPPPLKTGGARAPPCPPDATPLSVRANRIQCCQMGAFGGYRSTFLLQKVKVASAVAPGGYGSPFQVFRATVALSFFQRCQAFLVKLSSEIKARLPFDTEIFQLLGFLDPKIATSGSVSSLLPVCHKFSSFFSEDDCCAILSGVSFCSVIKLTMSYWKNQQ